MIKGSCTCGYVEFHISGELTDVSFCHCSICRKVSGSAFASYGSTPIGKFEWVEGKAMPRKYKFSNEVTKFFCSNCGSTLATHHSAEPTWYHISLGCIDGSPSITPKYHQYVGSKPSWSTISDGLLQYESWPDVEL
jgi:hypothetical protein